MIKLTKFRVIEISAAVVLTLAALVMLGWQAWATPETKPLSLANSKDQADLAHSRP